MEIKKDLKTKIKYERTKAKPMKNEGKQIINNRGMKIKETQRQARKQ